MGGKALWAKAAKGRKVLEPVERAFPPGSVGAARAWTIKARLKAAQLPTKGNIRYVPPRNYQPGNPLPRGPNNGYIDRVGNEWVKGPSRTPGQPFEWDVQLSRTGKEQIGWLSRDGNRGHVNVSTDGHVTH
jgi:filamentous hemagglutinin